MSRDKSRIVSLKYSHSKIWSAEVLASFHFSLSRCYLSTCGCTNKHVSHSSEHRGRPSNHHRPREAYVHTPTCVIIVTSRAISDRTLDRDQGQQIVKSQTSKGKRFSEVACFTVYLLFFSAARWRKCPRKLYARHARVLRTTLRGKWRSATAIDLVRFFISLSCVARSSTFLFHRTLINSRYARISFMIFVAQTPYATVCERRFFLSIFYLTRTLVYLAPFRAIDILRTKYLLEKKFYFSEGRYFNKRNE